jgi:purine-binding chemotaxis protein CheW
VSQTNPDSTDHDQRGGQFRTFALGKEHYGVEILQVREILALMEITRVPHTPPHVRGVVNRRGQLIKVIDLRTRLGLPAAAPTPETCVVFVEEARAGARLTAGLIVDRVLEVQEISGPSIERAPALGAANAAFFGGIAKAAHAITILLDIGRVVDVDRPESAHAA